jgi:uncharacterized Zn finger protein
MKKLRCGNCGESKHKLYQYERKDAIMVKCAGCGNKSEISTTGKPAIQIKWVKNSGGILAVF